MKKIVWAILKWWSDVSGAKKYLRFLEKEDRRRRIAGQFLTFITIGTGVFYLVWHWRYINWDAWYYSFVFFLAESVGFLLFCLFAFNDWFLRYHAPEGIPVERMFSVDVFIPVAGEPIDMLRETVEAAVRIDFQDKRIYILDDKGSEEYRKLSESYGCGYFARPDHDDAKAGNLNYAFFRTEGDLILALDADQVPQPQIINKLIGYFKIEKIAFVQSKQDFKVPVGDPFGNTDRIFYNVMQSGKDNDNAAFSCGSGVIYRRKALQEIGGFSTWNIVEDVHTSMLLHERGWRSVYHNYPLTLGTAPTEVFGVYRQRKQWAADSLRIQFWDNPFRHKGLSFKQRLQYFNLGFVYLVSAFIMPIFFITPILSLLAKKFILTAPVQQYVLHRSPYFVFMSLAYGMINYPTPYMKAFQMWTGLFPVFMRASWVALFSRKKKPPYRMNMKLVKHVKAKNPSVAVLPQLGIIILGLFSIIFAFIAGGMPWDYYLLNVLWITWAIWTMSGICLAALRKHSWPKLGASKEPTSSSFFAKTREPLVTLALTIGISILFVAIDPPKIENFLSSVRLRTLQSFRLEKPLSPVGVGTPKTGDVSDLRLNKTVESLQARNRHEGPQSEAWVVQVISVRTPKRAAIFKEQLVNAGFPAYTLSVKGGAGPWVLVRVGFFKSKDEAEEVAARIQRTTKAFLGPCLIEQASARDKERIVGK